ncbi:tyrosine-type recombinase/integrase [uncultured Rubinisphaera sp.]|uniref:tyrosine-type recombinase/integrase n=1 Tax=uncultured Rubinisphaera sp. TaxID=1678686 RepID=UPI000ED12660|nr:site-specific integrase [Planctomycetaceae bacterium]|tara:strand:- start:5338 stop:6603 length:1266 start_codon:yes stop_codon:yes gene_type:complete
MPRRRNLSPPSYCLHKASSRAVVRINGKDHYLGPYGSTESHAEYERIIANWRTNIAAQATLTDNAPALVAFDLTLTQVISRYRDFAQEYYSKDGKPTKEFVEMKYALRPLREMYGEMLIKNFGPKNLKAIRQHMIEEFDLSRGVVNARIKRIKRFFKWACSEELVPSTVTNALRDVSGLRRGRTTARETEPVTPIADVWVETVLPQLSPQIATMVKIQRLTGMRPGEVVLMRACDIEIQNEVWLYEPHDHKNQWREHSRLIPLGPKVQKLLLPFMDLKSDNYLFSPRDAEDWRNARRSVHSNPNRKTKIYPCELRARERRKVAAKTRTSKRPKRERYDVDSYRRAITYAISKLNRQREADGKDLIPQWYPLQLRHSRATEIRKDFGIEAAQVSLGHSHADVTQVYAERNLGLAIEIAKKTG